MSKETFDHARSGTGTREWAETNFNIGKGCANDCLYCYAAAMAANPFYGAWRKRSQWSHEQLSANADITSFPARDGVIMFPSTHDITPYYLPHFVRVALVMLAKGNRLLITTKPRLDSIRQLTDAFAPYRDQVLFRFTIGSTMDSDLLFWEPGAPLFLERFDALQLAHERGFKTSVSIEPMLAGWKEAIRVLRAVYPLVTDTIWIGRMNKARLRCDMKRPAVAAAVRMVEHLQDDASILKLVEICRFGLDKVRWKDSIREVIERC